jgi:hypothetical protein
MRCGFITLLTITTYVPNISYCNALNVKNDKISQQELTSQIKESSGNETSNVKSTITSIIRILRQQDIKKLFKNESINYFRNGSQQGSTEQNISGARPPASTAYKKAKRELPMALIIAGPTAAASIFIFLCVAYYFHNAQLNRKAKRLSATLFVPQDVNSLSSNCSSPTGVLPPSQRYIHTARLSRDSDIFGPRRKSMISIHTLSMPPSVHGKRGSNWSALADQEILSLSAPRRHSTFIL